MVRTSHAHHRHHHHDDPSVQGVKKMKAKLQTAHVPPIQTAVIRSPRYNIPPTYPSSTVASSPVVAATPPRETSYSYSYANPYHHTHAKYQSDPPSTGSVCSGSSGSRGITYERYGVSPSVERAAESREAHDEDSRNSGYYRQGAAAVTSTARGGGMVETREGTSSSSSSSSATTSSVSSSSYASSYYSGSQLSRSQASEVVASNIAAKIAAYQQNAKAISSPRVSAYSQATSTSSSSSSGPGSASVASYISEMSSTRGGGVEFEEGYDKSIAEGMEYWKQKELQLTNGGETASEAFRRHHTPSSSSNFSVKVEVTENVRTSRSNKTKESESSSSSALLAPWNMMKPFFRRGSSTTEKQDLGLVSKDELLHDLKENGLDKVKEFHQFLCDEQTIVDNANLVGTDIVACEGQAMESKKNVMGFMSQFVPGFAPSPSDLEHDDLDGEESDDASSTGSSFSRGSLEEDADQDPSSSPSILKKKGKNGKSKTKRGIMVQPGSTSSNKSVRFSDKVETREIKEAEAPKLPSLMDTDPNDADDSSVVSSDDVISTIPEEADDSAPSKKKKGLFKSLLKRKHKKKSKKAKKKSMATTFKPSLETTLEELDEQDNAEQQSESHDDDNLTVGAVAEASTTSPSTPPATIPITENSRTSDDDVHSTKSNMTEGFELIAGCTKTGKKAIMITKAKDNGSAERQEQSTSNETRVRQDPPPSELSAAPVVAAKDAPSTVTNNTATTSKNGHTIRSTETDDDEDSIQQEQQQFRFENPMTMKIIDMFDDFFATGVAAAGAGGATLEHTDSLRSAPTV